MGLHMRHFLISFLVALSSIDDAISELLNGLYNCTDTNSNCPFWAQSGNQCRESQWMLSNCRFSCRHCTSQTAKIAKLSSVETNAIRPNSLEFFCEDKSAGCPAWAANEQCEVNEFVAENCRFSCRKCHGHLPARYDSSKLPDDLKRIGFLVGRWRSESDGKIRFPSIPVFTYGEQLDITISEPSTWGPPSLNYSAFAWSISVQESLHAECGFITVKPKTAEIAFSTTMSNGFTTIEEGLVEDDKISLRLLDIGRISWGRDQPVLDLRRELKLMDNGQRLEQRLHMATLTSPLQEHALIRYKRIFP